MPAASSFVGLLMIDNY